MDLWDLSITRETHTVVSLFVSESSSHRAEAKTLWIIRALMPMDVGMQHLASQEAWNKACPMRLELK